MKRLATLSALALGGLWLWNKNRGDTPPQSGGLPGRTKRPTTRALETGAAMLQPKTPLEAMNLYLDGFHRHSADGEHQMEAHHYCAQLNEDVIQCAIFDGNTRDARLIGVEYIVSERLFETFPAEEKKLWHSHRYEVSSGTLVAPNLPISAEHELMKKVVNTYGKTWHTWQSGRDELPFGIPALMMAFTADGQLHLDLQENRDRRMNVSTAQRRANRADIPVTPPDPAADSWQTGPAPRIELAESFVETRS
jgi:hypothetical protein